MNLKIIQQVVSCFENSSPDLNYAYCEDIGDGRGFTCGIAGWTTADGDVRNIIDKYPSLSGFKSTSTIELKLLGFPKAWAIAAKNSAFCLLQDLTQIDEYFTPALDLAARYSVTSPIGQLIFCDTIIQHGMESDSGTSLGLRDMAAYASRYVTANETEYLKAFLAKRENILVNGGDEWLESVGRVYCLGGLLQTNPALQTPFKINPWGDQFFEITG